MEKNNKRQTKYICREYIDSDGWHVTEIIGAHSHTLLKTKGDRLICDNNGSIYEGVFDPELFDRMKNLTSDIKLDDERLDAFIDSFSRNWVNRIFAEDNDENIIDLIEDTTAQGGSYKYIPITKATQTRDTGCQGCGCGCLLFVVLFTLIISGILQLLGEAAQAIVQFIVNFF